MHEERLQLEVTPKCESRGQNKRNQSEGDQLPSVCRERMDGGRFEIQTD
jgi:hypothetical protein